ELVANQKDLNFKPGEEHLYCNTGFTLLAEVVARVSKQSFADFVKSNIFDPLGMTHSLFYDDYEMLVKNRAYAYWPEGVKFKKGILSSSRVGPTGLFTSLEDLSLWTKNFSNPTVGNANIISQMNTLATLNNGKTFGGAYGQYITEYKGLHQIYHGGSSEAGYRAYLGRFPDQEFAVIVLSNFESANPNRLSMQVVDLYLKEFMSQNTSDEKQEEITYEKLGTEDLQAFEGYYWDAQRFTSSKIYVKNDTLRWSIGGGGNGSPLGSIANNTFQILNGRRDLSLLFEQKDQAKRMMIAIDNLDPIICEAYVPKSYAQEDLAQFTGSFYSEELQTTYTFLLKDGQLVAEHTRVNDISFTEVQEDMFSGDQSFFTNVKFLRNDQNEIIGMHVSSFQLRNLYFEKVKP
ncbi:MAG: serine hydrolase domain-containing protein, partial [Bacteroidota bacterium]